MSENVISNFLLLFHFQQHTLVSTDNCITKSNEKVQTCVKWNDKLFLDFLDKRNNNTGREKKDTGNTRDRSVEFFFFFFFFLRSPAISLGFTTFWVRFLRM